jgi:hypothetical protein
MIASSRLVIFSFLAQCQISLARVFSCGRDATCEGLRLDRIMMLAPFQPRVFIRDVRSYGPQCQISG